MTPFQLRNLTYEDKYYMILNLLKRLYIFFFYTLAVLILLSVSIELSILQIFKYQPFRKEYFCLSNAEILRIQ